VGTLAINCFSYLGTTPTMSCPTSSPNLRTPVITFVNAHTISHYLQTSVLTPNRTLSIECYSEISINLVFRSQCHFASIFSLLQMFVLYNQFLFSFLHFILCRMCVCHMFNKVLTYLLTFINCSNQEVVLGRFPRWNCADSLSQAAADDTMIAQQQQQQQQQY